MIMTQTSYTMRDPESGRVLPVIDAAPPVRERRETARAGVEGGSPSLKTMVTETERLIEQGTPEAEAVRLAAEIRQKEISREISGASSAFAAGDGKILDSLGMRLKQLSGDGGETVPPAGWGPIAGEVRALNEVAAGVARAAEESGQEVFDLLGGVEAEPEVSSRSRKNKEPAHFFEEVDMLAEAPPPAPATVFAPDLKRTVAETSDDEEDIVAPPKPAVRPKPVALPTSAKIAAPSLKVPEILSAAGEPLSEEAMNAPALEEVGLSKPGQAEQPTEFAPEPEAAAPVAEASAMEPPPLPDRVKVETGEAQEEDVIDLSEAIEPVVEKRAEQSERYRERRAEFDAFFTQCDSLLGSSATASAETIASLQPVVESYFAAVSLRSGESIVVKRRTFAKGTYAEVLASARECEDLENQSRPLEAECRQLEQRLANWNAPTESLSMAKRLLRTLNNADVIFDSAKFEERKAAMRSRIDARREELNKKQEEIKRLRETNMVFVAEVRRDLRERRFEIFINQPLGNIHEQLRQGERHPRIFTMADHENQTPEQLAVRSMKPELAQAYTALTGGLAENGAEARPAETLQASRKAAIQIENGFYGEAAATVRELMAALPPDDPSRERLREILPAIEKENVDKPAESARRMSELYAHLTARSQEIVASTGAELERTDLTPEQRQDLEQRNQFHAEQLTRIDKRVTLERTLREGDILEWRAFGKAVTTPEAGTKLADEQENALLAQGGQEGDIPGVEKVYLVTLHKVDKDGKKMYDKDGKKVTVKVFAKTTHNEVFVRPSIPPHATDVTELGGAYLAVASGTMEIAPSTVIRGTEVGNFTFQEALQGEDADGAPVDMLKPKMCKTPDGQRDRNWADRIPKHQREMGGLLQTYMKTADHGVPGNGLKPQPDGSLLLGVIDFAQSLPAEDDPNYFVSYLGAINHIKRTESELSPQTLLGCEQFISVSDMAREGMAAMLPYDMSSYGDHWKKTAAEALRTKRAPEYTGTTFPGYMRDGGQIKRFFETQTKKLYTPQARQSVTQ